MAGFAGYKDLADCIAKNEGKGDPAAYCAIIAKAAGNAPAKGKKPAPPRPDSDSDFAESEAPLTISEAVVMLDRAPTHAKVVQVGEDTIVIPDYDGAFDALDKPWQAATPLAYDNSPYDLEDAARTLGTLARIRSHERDETEQADILATAIDAIASYLQAEATEDQCEGCGHAMGCDCSTCDCDNHGAVAEAAAFMGWVVESFRDDEFQTAISEVGRRNSTKDAATLRQIIDLVNSLGVDITPPAADEDAGEVEPVAEAATVGGDAADITFREAGAYGMTVTLAEAAPVFDAEERVVWVTPIRPGWGNTRDNNYYPTETLKEATLAGRFNHLKMYKDHPTKEGEKQLPERSVKDWFATTREAVWDDTRQKPRVPVKVHDDADFRRMQEAPEQVAFSVLGGGMARPGTGPDGKKGRIVESISKLRSLDWVTEAGAGGGIEFAESASTEEQDMHDIENLTAEQLAEANPGLYGHIVGLGKALAALDRAPKDEAPEADADGKKKADAAKTDGEAAVKESMTPDWATSIIERLDRIENRETAVASSDSAKADAAKVVKTVVDASTLLGSAKDIVTAGFAEATVGAGQQYADATSLKEAVEARLSEAEALIKPFMGKSGVTGLGATTDGSEKSPTSLMESRLDEKYGPTATPRKDRLVFTSEQLGDPAAASTGVDAHPVSEAAAGVAGNIAAKF